MKSPSLLGETLISRGDGCDCSWVCGVRSILDRTSFRFQFSLLISAFYFGISVFPVEISDTASLTVATNAVLILSRVSKFTKFVYGNLTNARG